MAKKLYVGNLSYNSTDFDLEQLFGQYGEVASAQVIVDRYSNQSKGFGFVEMNDNSQADAAIKALNGNNMNGRTIKVNQAKPRADRSSGSRRF